MHNEGLKLTIVHSTDIILQHIHFRPKFEFPKRLTHALEPRGASPNIVDIVELTNFVLTTISAICFSTCEKVAWWSSPSSQFGGFGQECIGLSSSPYHGNVIIPITKAIQFVIVASSLALGPPLFDGLHTISSTI